MLMIVGISGVLLALLGVSLYRKRRKLLGTLLAVVGASLAVLAVVGVTSLHP
jgi:hypothetical protein